MHSSAGLSHAQLSAAFCCHADLTYSFVGFRDSQGVPELVDYQQLLNPEAGLVENWQLTLGVHLSTVTKVTASCEAEHTRNCT